MNKYIVLLVMGLLGASICNASETICTDPRPTVCTMDYSPVCGASKNKMTTYANGCSACSKQEVVSYVQGKCPARTLSAEEVTQLFSGQTYEATIPSRNIQMTVYSAPDGSMTGMQGGKKFTSKWAVSESGEICVSYRDKMSCRMVMEDNGVYKKYKLNEKGEKVILVVYQSFTPGNVHNY